MGVSPFQLSPKNKKNNFPLSFVIPKPKARNLLSLGGVLRGRFVAPSKYRHSLRTSFITRRKRSFGMKLKKI
jgi:hypothetical protein